MSTYVDRLTFLESLSWMTQPRDFPENPVRYRTDDVVKGVYVFQEHEDYPRWIEPILWLVAASSLAGFAYLVVRLIGG